MRRRFKMGRFLRIAVPLVALLSMLAAFSSSAGAVTWHNTGDSHFLATGGAGTLASTGATLGCVGSDGTGTAPSASSVGATLIVSGTFAFTGCTLSGQSIGFECGYTFTGTSWVAGTPAVTSGNFDLTCGWYLSGTKVCHIEGSIPAHYTNPNGATSGKLVTTTSTNVFVTNGPVSSCLLGNGDAVHLTALTFNISDTVQPLGPVFTRTA
jgi:hypothetical protein